MDIKQLKSELANIQLRVKQFGRLAPKIAAVTAVGLFKENFQNESFFGRKWKAVQRSIPGTPTYKRKYTTSSGKKYEGAHHSWKILTNEGDLGRSIKKQIVSGGVIIFSDLKYSKIHNQGGHAGRHYSVKITPRRFMGKHKKLEADITVALQKQIDLLNL
jgi:phage gpG-like protein